MQSLSQAVEGQHYTVKGLHGNTRFISRITSVGLTIGATVKVIRNAKRMPILIYTRDTMLAVDKKEAEQIKVEVNK